MGDRSSLSKDVAANVGWNSARKPHDLHEESIELRPDGEQRFRAAVRAAAKSGPKHRSAKG